MAPGFTFFYSSLLTGLYILVAANASRGNFLCPFDSLYQFGDSISDTGNLIRVPGVGPTLPAARFPYGQTIGRPTGRWSDGLLIIDFTGIFANFSDPSTQNLSLQYYSVQLLVINKLSHCLRFLWPA